jgi:hypothetical protein
VVVTIEEFGTSTVLLSLVLSLVEIKPISYIIPVLLYTVISSPNLNGLIKAKYNPAMIFPIIFWEAKPTTKPEIVPIEAATTGSLLKYEIIIAIITIAPIILIRILIDFEVSFK